MAVTTVAIIRITATKSHQDLCNIQLTTTLGRRIGIVGIGIGTVNIVTGSVIGTACIVTGSVIVIFVFFLFPRVFLLGFLWRSCSTGASVTTVCASVVIIHGFRGSLFVRIRNACFLIGTEPTNCRGYVNSWSVRIEKCGEIASCSVRRKGRR
jgi:hypothetical protein